MNAAELIAKAERAAASAKLLLDTGDTEGACDRAYYAMFNAARSALSLYLVKTDLVPVMYGRALNRVEELRLIADYKGDQIEPEKAAWAVDQAQDFVLAMRTMFAPDVGSSVRPMR